MTSYHRDDRHARNKLRRRIAELQQSQARARNRGKGTGAIDRELEGLRARLEALR